MDESKPLIVSQAIAGAIGAAWLLLVFLTPPPPPTISLLRPEEAAAVEVEFEDEKPKPAAEPKPDEPPPADPSEAAKSKAEAKARQEADAAANAFGGGSSVPAGDVTNALRGVAVTKGAGGGSGGGSGGGIGGGKAVIGYGAGGGSRTPGKGIDPSVAAAGENIGTVNASGNVSRANIAVAAPTIVRSADGGASGRDMARLGTFVRGRNAQLQYCYRDVGLPLNERLAGSINVAITMDAAGKVTEARVGNRTWSGAGVAETEACVVERVKGWAFPASSKAGSETYSFSFIFNR